MTDPLNQVLDNSKVPLTGSNNQIEKGPPPPPSTLRKIGEGIVSLIGGAALAAVVLSAAILKLCAVCSPPGWVLYGSIAIYATLAVVAVVVLCLLGNDRDPVLGGFLIGFLLPAIVAYEYMKGHFGPL